MELVFIAILGVFSLRAVREVIKYIKNSWNRLKNRWEYSWKYRWRYGWNSWSRWKQRWKHRWGNSWWGRNFDFTALVIVSLIFGLGGFVCSAEFLDWVSSEKKYKTIWHYVFQNPLVLAALIGFPILIKRVSETRLQSRSMQYNAANELLWSPNLGSRMAGINALWRLADNYPKEEYHHVMDVFAQFIKNPIPYEWKIETKTQDRNAGKRDDIHEILQHIGKERMVGTMLYKIDLRGAFLEGANLFSAFLERANLRDAHLKRANLLNARLEGADLWSAHLEDANLLGARLTGADLWDAHLNGADLMFAYFEEAILVKANLEGADLEKANLKLALINEANFKSAKNLTQEQIDESVLITGSDFFGFPYFADKPPILPTGIKPTYIEMALDEWRGARKQESRHILHEHLHFRF